MTSPAVETQTTPSTLPASNTPIATISKLTDQAREGRFDIYLAVPEIPASRVNDYLGKITQITSYLNDNNVFDARKTLDILNTYQDIDAGLSGELANRVDVVLQMQHIADATTAATKQLQSSLAAPDQSPDAIADNIRKQEEDQRKGKGRVEPGDVTAGPIKLTVLDTNAPPGAITQALPPPAGMSETPQLTQNFIRTVETKDKITTNNGNENKLIAQGRLEFVQYVSQLYETHHYYQALIAAGFFRTLFKETAYPSSMAAQVASCNDSNDKIFQIMQAVQTNSDKGSIANAAERLETAFSLGEFHPAVLGFSLAQKKRVGLFRRALAKAQNSIEARDFNNVDSLLNDIQKIAPDFDTVEIRNKIDALKTSSRQLWTRAQTSAQGGDLKSALAEFQQAAEAWPGNPDLANNAVSRLGAEAGQEQSMSTFDLLFAASKYREIVDQQSTFATALQTDTKRQEELKRAVGLVQSTDTAIDKASVMATSGNSNGAWEIVHVALQTWPSDPKLKVTDGDLTGKDTDFVSAINKAEDAEVRQELGYSLTWYGIAKQRYPSSQIASQGINRLTERILSKDRLKEP